MVVANIWTVDGPCQLDIPTATHEEEVPRSGVPGMPAAMPRMVPPPDEPLEMESTKMKLMLSLGAPAVSRQAPPSSPSVRLR